MLTQLIVTVCFIATVLGGAYEDEVVRKQKIVERFWANNVTTSLRNWQRSIYPANPYAVPVGFVKGNAFIVYLETGKGKSIVLPKPLLDGFVKKAISQPIHTQWLDIMFDSEKLDLTTDTSARDGRGIVVYTASKSFDPEILYNDWVAGKTGPIFIESNYDVFDSPNNMLAELMGIYLEGAGLSMSNPIERLVYTPEGKTEPANMPLLAYLEDVNNILKYPLKYYPQDGSGIAYIASKCRVSADLIYQVVKKYKGLLQESMPSENNLHSLTNTVFPREILNTLNMLVFSHSLNQFSQDKLDELELNFGFIGGYKRDGSGIRPEVGDYEVTIEPKWTNHVPTGLFSLPNTVYEYEVVESTWNKDIFLQTNHLSDNLSRKSTVKRLPFAKSYIHTRSPKGKFYSPTGGPIHIMDRNKNYNGRKVTIKFKNVALTPGIDIRVNATHDRWASGYFNDTKLRWAEIACDSVWFVMELENVETYSVQGMKDYCHMYDTFIKGMINFSGFPDRNRMGFIFDIQPSVGSAHSGNPIVALSSWQTTMLSKTPMFMSKEPTSYWGSLHEIGHNLQQGQWTFPGFTEVTNNVMVLYAQEVFANTSGPPFTNAVYRNNQAVAKFLLGQKGAISDIFGYLHYYTTLKFDFGWALIGNNFNKYKVDNSNVRAVEQWVKYMTEQTNMNMVPYHFFFKFDKFFTDIKATYQEYAHLPVYRPSGEIFDLAIERWNEAKQFFNFSDDRPASGKIAYEFDQRRDFESIGSPSTLLIKL